MNAQSLDHLLNVMDTLLKLKNSEGVRFEDLDYFLQIMIKNFNLDDYDCANERELIEKYILPAGFAKVYYCYDQYGRAF